MAGPPSSDHLTRTSPRDQIGFGSTQPLQTPTIASSTGKGADFVTPARHTNLPAHAHGTRRHQDNLLPHLPQPRALLHHAPHPRQARVAPRIRYDGGAGLHHDAVRRWARIAATHQDGAVAGERGDGGGRGTFQAWEVRRRRCGLRGRPAAGARGFGTTRGSRTRPLRITSWCSISPSRAALLG